MKLNSIMLVDDDTTSNFLHHCLIESMDLANNIIIIDNTELALDYLLKCLRNPIGEKSSPELLLLDVNMPRLDGFEFLSALAASDCRHRLNLYVAMLSTSELLQDQQKASRLGADDYLSKPLTEAKMQELMGRCQHKRMLEKAFSPSTFITIYPAE